MLLGHTQKHERNLCIWILFILYSLRHHLNRGGGANLDNVPDVCSNFVTVRPAKVFLSKSFKRCDILVCLYVMIRTVWLWGFFFSSFDFMTLWFLVTRPLGHHTGEASSTIHTTSPAFYTDTCTKRARLQQSRSRDCRKKNKTGLSGSTSH